jgi:urate oxidase
MAEAFLSGDNSEVVPTDTCKNTVYCVANKHEFKSIEEFGMLLCKHFLNEYPSIVNKISVEIIRDQWERISTPDSTGRMAPHKHVFRRFGPCKPFTRVQGTKRNGSNLTLDIESGFRNMDIMKTTQSGFVNFHKCKFTSLPEVADRILGTSVDATWYYNRNKISRGGVDFNAISSAVQTALINTFAGPSDKGVYSKSVQQTLYEMAESALRVAPTVDKMRLEMPNIHNLSFPLQNYGLQNKDHTGNPTIFYPIDEPHGMIKAELARTPSARL